MFEVNNKLYETIKDGKIVETFSNLNIVFDPTWKKVGVNLSGGADSALLTFFICSIIEKHNLDCTVTAITYQRCWETRPWQGYISIQVYNWLKGRFPKIIVDRITNYIPPELEHGAIGPIINGRSGDQIIVGSFNRFAAWENNLNAVFNATSKNPDAKRADRMTNRDKDAEDGVLEDVWRYGKKEDAYLVHPFRFVKKDWIVAQYFIYGINELYYTTRSCEGDIEQHEIIKRSCGHFKDYKDGMDIPLCKQCWWCEERQWAEDRLQETIKEIDRG